MNRVVLRGAPHPAPRLSICAGLAALSLACQSHAAADAPYPSSAGALNVRDFGAVGDGVHDDTAAFASALAQSSERAEHWHVRIVQLPAGTYRVSDTIAKRFADGGYNAGLVLIGAGESRTVIKLADGAPGFQDPAHPKAVILTAGKGFAQSPKNGYALRGEGNDGFSNFVESLTVDVGHNPGAIGIDYLANNQGALRAVTVEGSGCIGISLARPWFGPGLLEKVTVKGFDVGLDVASIDYGVTAEGLTLIGQRQTALRNLDNLVAVHDLVVRGGPNLSAAAIDNSSAASMLVVDGGRIEARGPAAVLNRGYVYVRNLEVSGFDTFLGSKVSPGTTVDGVYQESKLISRASPTWALHGKAEPLPVSDPPASWASVAAYAAPGEHVGEDGVDATGAVRAALASGARTVFFPFGVYPIRANLDVPASVERIVGMNSTVFWSPSGTDRSVDDPGSGLLRTHNGKGPLLIEKFFFNFPKGNRVAIEDSGSGPLVIRDVVAMGAILRRDADGGALYASNVNGGFLLNVSGSAPVYGRQVDTEGGGARGGTVKVRITNDGAPMWILGLKSEGNNTLVASSGGAVTDILGTLVAPLTSASVPLFASVDARLQATGVEIAFKPEATYRWLLQGSLKGVDISVPADRMPPRPSTQGIFFPRIVSGE
jgi:Pectate lyase superfamily protein